jgi:alpha-galactosidase
MMIPDTNCGSRNQYTFNSIYANTTSANHTVTVQFTKPATSKTTIQLQSSSQTVKVPVALSARSVSTKIFLTAGSSNTVTISSATSIQSIQIVSPQGTYYPCTSFALNGSTKFEQCDAGFCAPVGSKIGYITAADTAHLKIPASVAGASGSTVSKYLEIDYINNDIALSTSWGWGSSSRNLTISLNGRSPVRLEVPLSGRHSELFGPGKGWWDSATLGILIDGWKNGSNDVVIGNDVGGDVSQTYGADFVGLRLYD